MHIVTCQAWPSPRSGDDAAAPERPSVARPTAQLAARNASDDDWLHVRVTAAPDGDDLTGFVDALESCDASSSAALDLPGAVLTSDGLADVAEWVGAVFDVVDLAMVPASAVHALLGGDGGDARTADPGELVELASALAVVHDLTLVVVVGAAAVWAVKPDGRAVRHDRGLPRADLASPDEAFCRGFLEAFLTDPSDLEAVVATSVDRQREAVRRL